MIRAAIEEALEHCVENFTKDQIVRDNGTLRTAFFDNVLRQIGLDLENTAYGDYKVIKAGFVEGLDAAYVPRPENEDAEGRLIIDFGSRDSLKAAIGTVCDMIKKQAIA
jgi:hypothetical protein